MGQSLDGAKFVVSGEPLTKSKRAFIEEVAGMRYRAMDAQDYIKSVMAAAIRADG